MKTERKSDPFLSLLPTRMILMLYSIVVLYPLIWTMYTSFKTTNEFYDSPWALPKQFYFENYVKAFTEAQIGHYFINSAVVTIVALLICNSISFAAAYAITRFRFPFSGFLRRMFMSALFFPIAFSIVPLFMLLNKLHLLDNLAGLGIAYAAHAIPFTIYLLTGFLVTIPKEYEEAAMIDGCSHFGILLRVIAPMAKAGVVTITIFNFMAFWNEYIMALSFISTESKRTLTLGLAYLMEVQRYATDWGALFAGLVTVMIPTMVLYAILQRQITSGISLGGLKG
ncbi:Diacetylchitobiose uptake system permease protein NgcG [Paenibacillus sp. CECT 9249]|uniref:carbohydrate ABC transporter permease n=1 Tax=Paenibacillus sp. CECT 9249 TaxID=2845385 RepID=UPI001E29B7FD|nr:carbohydrate ABC transporter permease [Paenibacillus sp. CECT 9249]CAH0120898.1 Diacetylchitobiose uptake system permease protein NgcG [Paenibacillus sp. CECT 9249]